MVDCSSTSSFGGHWLVLLFCLTFIRGFYVSNSKVLAYYIVLVSGILRQRYLPFITYFDLLSEESSNTLLCATVSPL